MQAFSISPASLFRAAGTHRAMLLQLVVRDVSGRYRGAYLGLLWSLFTPLLMLSVYTLVFAGVFNARWPGGNDTALEFALLVFVGLIVFSLLAECVSRAPGLIVENSNFVKKLVFPLEILPLALLGGALFHALVSLLVWLLAYLLLYGLPSATALLLPLSLLPVVLLTAGTLWLLAALGVYLRDIGQLVTPLLTAMLFLSAVFYPVLALPESMRGLLLLINPLAAAIEQTRAVLYWGQGLNWSLWLLQMLLGMLVAWAGYAWFQKTRRGFADVL